MSFMLNAATQYDTNAQFGEEGGYKTMAEVFKNGGQYFLLGMLAVFAVLGFIWVAIELFHRFCSAIPPKKTEDTDEVPVPVKAPTVSAAPEPAATGTDEEIVAVIIAAIEAAKAETPNGKFRVVSFRKK